MRILFLGALLGIAAALGCASSSSEKVHANSGKPSLATSDCFWGKKELGDVADD